MTNGWVKIYRVSIEKDWLKNSKLWTFWIYCLLKATHTPFIAKVGFQEVPLLPGQFMFGRKVASKETDLTEQNIRTCIQYLIKSKNLTIKSTNKYSIITIVNWEFYQGAEDKSTSNLTSNQPATNQQLTTYKNNKNKKNVKNNKHPLLLLMIDRGIKKVEAECLLVDFENDVFVWCGEDYNLIEFYCEWYDKEKPKSPGWLVKAIREGWQPDKKFKTQRQIKKADEEYKERSKSKQVKSEILDDKDIDYREWLAMTLEERCDIHIAMWTFSYLSQNKHQKPLDNEIAQERQKYLDNPETPEEYQIRMFGKVKFKEDV